MQARAELITLTVFVVENLSTYLLCLGTCMTVKLFFYLVFFSMKEFCLALGLKSVIAFGSLLWSQWACFSLFFFWNCCWEGKPKCFIDQDGHQGNLAKTNFIQGKQKGLSGCLTKMATRAGWPELVLYPSARRSITKLSDDSFQWKQSSVYYVTVTYSALFPRI